MEQAVERQLYIAALNGNEEEVRKILKENRRININWKRSEEKYDGGDTTLHVACNRGHDEIVSLLLAHPDINVNQKSFAGFTPFSMTCMNGSTGCARLLLKDDRVNLNDSDIFGRTPLWWAAETGRLDRIEWWISSGREIELGEPGNEKTNAIEAAKRVDSWREEDFKKRKAGIATLLERFKANPVETRHQVRMKLDCFQELAAEMFVLVIFLCDGLLEIKEETRGEAARFFRIAKELSVELQMILCHRVVGSMAINIPGEEREAAFRALARYLH